VVYENALRKQRARSYTHIVWYICIYKQVCIYADVSTSHVMFIPSSFTWCFP
jgi:hypothetical protein